MASNDPGDLDIEKAVAALMRGCLDVYRTNLNKPAAAIVPFDAALGDTLTTLLGAMASLHDVLFRGQGWRADPVHAGYLLKTDAGVSMRVPYHVLPTFPSGPELTALFEVSRAVRSANGSIVCISGSNVLRRVFDVVNDVDFCEYLDITQNNAFANVAGNLKGDNDLLCLRVKLADKDWKYPSAGKPTSAFIAKTLNSMQAESATLKMDYAGNLANFGPASITNVIIATDGQGRSAGLDKTFAAQEAPLVPSNWIPNAMADPNEMGRYIDWLVRMVVHHANADELPKSLKRAASLSRVTFQRDVTDRIRDLASETTVYLDKKLDELRTLKGALKGATDARSGALLDAIAQQELDLRARKKARTQTAAVFDRRAKTIARSLLKRIDKRAAAAL